MKNYSTNKQTIANRKWQEKNKEKKKYLSDRSRAKSFIRNASTKDLHVLSILINIEAQKELGLFINEYNFLIDEYLNDSLLDFIGKDNPLRKFVKEGRNDTDYN